MNLTSKISPKGIDVVVNEIQNHLSTTFSTWTNFNCYPRIYKEETQSGVNPKHYVGSGDYESVFLNDTLDGSCFFYEEDTRNATDNGYFNSVKLSIVFQMNLTSLYPTITHRADEEAHNQVIIALKKLMPYKVTNLVTGYKNVYAEFDTSQVQYDDISQYHVFRIDMEVIVNNNCN